MSETSTLQLWSYSLSSTFIVSIIPIFFLFLVPLLKSRKSGVKTTRPVSVSGRWLTWFLCFAAGALLGDAFLHLINGHHDDGNHNHHDHSHSHKYDGLAILLGILVFFGIEIFSSSSCHGHHHHQLQRQVTQKSSNKENKSDEEEDVFIAQEQNEISGHGVNGFLSLLADSIHNFTDGLTIAAAYARSTSSGISTTIAIFVHEIPHEMGDYAVLIKAGFTHPQVLKCQFLTAAAAFCGTLLGLLLQSSGNSFLLSAFKSILPFSAGGFIYLALASIIPEIMREQRCKSQAIIQFLVFSSGIFLMTILD